MSKIDATIKIEYVKDYLNGCISQRFISEQLDVSLATVQQWIGNYKSMGEDAFLRNGAMSRKSTS